MTNMLIKYWSLETDSHTKLAAIGRLWRRRSSADKVVFSSRDGKPVKLSGILYTSDSADFTANITLNSEVKEVELLRATPEKWRAKDGRAMFAKQIQSGAVRDFEDVDLFKISLVDGQTYYALRFCVRPIMCYRLSKL